MYVRLNIYTLMMIALLPSFMFIPSITILSEFYNSSFSIMQLSVSLFMVASSLLQLILGPLSDKYGRRPVLLFCLAVLIFSSIGCIFSPSIELFFLFRILQASAVAGMVIGRAIVIDIYPKKDTVKILSQIAIVLGISSIIGPALGGYLIFINGWKTIFQFITIITLISIIYNFFTFEETNKNLLSNFNMQVISYKKLLSSFRFWIYSLIGGFSSSAFFTILISAPFIGEVIYDLSAFESSLLIIIITSGFILGSSVSPFLLNFLNEKKLLVLSMISSSTGLITSFTLYIVFPDNILSIFGPFFLIGLSNGFISPVALSKVLSIRDDSRGAASGLNGALIVGFGAIYSAMSGYLLGYFGAVYIIYIMIFISLCLTYFTIMHTDDFKIFKRNSIF